MEKQQKFFLKNEKNLGEQQDKLKSIDTAIRVNNFFRSYFTMQSSAINSNAIETVGCCRPSRMARKHIRCLLERKGKKRKRAKTGQHTE